MTKRSIVITLFGIFLSVTELSAQNVVYVNQAATGANTGASWGDAFVFLQDALEVAQSGDEIWVAAGVYYPDKGANVTEGDRAATFQLMSGVALYGGFAGTETAREERDWELNLSILSGDLLSNDSGNVSVENTTRSDNSFRVVSVEFQELQIMLDGFVITSGNADGPQRDIPLPSLWSGGGIAVIQSDVMLQNLSIERNAASLGGGGAWFIRSSLWIENVRVTNNNASSVNGVARGGGIILEGGNTSMRDVTIFQNSATDAGGMYNIAVDTLLMRDVNFEENKGGLGGGMYNFNSSPFISNAYFLANEASEGGAGLFNEAGSSPKLVNTVFSGNKMLNTQFFGGGGMMNFRSSPIIINSLFSLNSSENLGGAIYNHESDSISIFNSILWDNVSSDDFQIYNRSSAEFPQLNSFTSIAHSIVEGELPEGMITLGEVISMDPLFINALGIDGVAGTLDDNFRLQENSPAIDVGDNMALPLDTFDLDQDGVVAESFSADLDLKQRIFDGGSGINQVDLGPFEYNSTPVNVGKEEPGLIASQETTLSVYPNPLSESALIRIYSNGSRPVTIQLYDLLGRKVSTVFQGHVREGNNQIRLEASRLPGGLYMLWVSLENKVMTKSVVVIH